MELARLEAATTIPIRADALGAPTGLVAEDQGRPTEDQVRAQVDKILRTARIARNGRGARLLRYIVDQALAGNAARLKQYSIATEALGRGSGFDPDTDPVVRLEASKLRRALDDYYLRSPTAEPVRISVPKGGYVPSFQLIHDEHIAARATSATAEIEETALRVQRLLVRPFHTQFGGATSQALAEGLFEQLIVELARYSDISLVTSLEPPDETTTDLAGAGTKAKAQFVLSGSVRGSDDQLRVTARLHDVRAGAIVWTECYDLAAGTTHGLHVEDSIARRVSGAVADFHGVISHTLSLRSVYAGGRAWSLQDAIQRHRYLARTLTENVYRIARADLEIGTTRAAHHPMIWAALAHTIFYGNVLGFDTDENWMALVDRYAHRAFELDHRCAFGHVVMGLHALYRRDFDGVFETCRRILIDNPHAPSARLSAGFFRASAGGWDEGTAMVRLALADLLHPPGWAYRITFLDHYRHGRYAEALQEIGKYHAPENFTPALLRAAALGHLGRIEEARASIAEVLRVCPRLPEVAPRYFHYLTAFDDMHDHLIDGLGKAGLTLPSSLASGNALS